MPVFKDPSEEWPEGLFTSADVKDRLRDVFTGWVESAERLSAVRSLYLSAAYGKSFLELKLLALAQAAEAYHRRSYEGQDCYMDAAAYADTVRTAAQGGDTDRHQLFTAPGTQEPAGLWQ